MSNSPDDTTASTPARPLAAIILAAGKGTRMQSDLPKVVHPVADHPMVWWVVEAARNAGAGPIVLVVGHGAELVQDVFKDNDDDIRYVMQDQQLGTGHATLCAKPALEGFDGDVLVLAGDGPLIRTSTIHAMHQRHVDTDASGTLATSHIDDPTGYGRIVRDENNRFSAIVEHKNATPEQLAIHEVYPSYATFDCRSLFEQLEALGPDSVTGEYYVTDVPAMLHAAGRRVEIIDAVPAEDVLSINTPDQLAGVDAILRRRLAGESSDDHTPQSTGIGP